MSEFRPMTDDELAELKDANADGDGSLLLSKDQANGVFARLDQAEAALTNNKDQLIRTIEQARKFRAERDALQAVVDKLPKTADGVVVVPRMTLYTRDGELSHGFTAGIDALGIVVDQWDHEVDAPFYSTREAAEAAMATPTDKERTDD